MADGDDATLAAALAERVATHARMAAALVELDRHPGHALLTGTTFTGVTDERWTTARDTLAGLWRDFDAYGEVVSAAQQLADRRRPSDADLQTLRRLLTGTTIEDRRVAVALPERGLTGTGERVHRIGLDDLHARMEAAFSQVSTLFVDVEAAHTSAHDALATLADRLRPVRVLAGELGAEQDTVAELVRRLDERDKSASTDPLGAATAPDLAPEIDAVAARLHELTAAREAWTGRVAGIDAALTRLPGLRRDLAEQRAAAQELILATLPPAPPDRLAQLTQRRASLEAVGNWTARLAAADTLETAVTAELAAVEEARELAVGLLERRSELRGRYEAYKAKATRMGRAELPGILTLDAELRDVLWTKPCDLGAATRALAGFQRLLVEGGSEGVR